MEFERIRDLEFFIHYLGHRSGGYHTTVDIEIVNLCTHCILSIQLINFKTKKIRGLYGYIEMGTGI